MKPLNEKKLVNIFNDLKKMVRRLFTWKRICLSRFSFEWINVQHGLCLIGLRPEIHMC